MVSISQARATSELDKAAEALRERDDLYRRVIAEADAVAYQRDVNKGTYDFVGDGIERLTGYPAEEFTLAAFQSLIQETILRGPCVGLTAREGLRRIQTGELDVWHADVRIRTHSGEERWLADTSIVIREENGESTGSLGILQDITDRKRAEDVLSRLAVTDELTGLHNRRYLMDRLGQEFDRATRYGTPLCLLMMDLDHFKAINDVHGHITGDGVLASVARVVRDTIRGTDIAGRFGGEEFCVALVQTKMGGAKMIAERLRRIIEHEVIESPDKTNVCVTASLGIAQLDEGSPDLETLISMADSAMYQAKEQGRNRVVCAHH